MKTANVKIRFSRQVFYPPLLLRSSVRVRHRKVHEETLTEYLFMVQYYNMSIVLLHLRGQDVLFFLN